MNTYTKREREINDLTRLDKLPMSSGQKEEDLIQTTELQGYKLIRRSKLRIYAIHHKILPNKLNLKILIPFTSQRLPSMGTIPSIYSQKLHDEKKSADLNSDQKRI